jgi:hypothetical protein
MLALYTLLFLNGAIMSWLLANSILSRYLAVQQGGVFLGFIGAVMICLAAVLVISILQRNKDAISDLKDLQ